jgi:hypothetical protein
LPTTLDRIESRKGRQKGVIVKLKRPRGKISKWIINTRDGDDARIQACSAMETCPKMEHGGTG